MSDFSPYFTDPCELVAIVYASDGITKLGRYSFRGYAKGMNRFFQICNLFTWEMSYLLYVKVSEEDKRFKTFADTLRSSIFWRVNKGEVNSLEDAIKQRISDLKKYAFESQKIFLFLPESEATSLDRKKFEIDANHIFKWIMEMRQLRIEFYERVLQEYKARKDQYNQRLHIYFKKNEEENLFKEVVEFTVDSVLAELKVDFEKDNNGIVPEHYYQIINQSWYLADLLKLDDPEIERYQGLSRYRTRSLHAHPEGLKAFFELFSIFKDEMSFILPDEPDKSFFERVLTVLKRDFFSEFERYGDLEVAISDYIEELEKYEFLSLPKDLFFDKLSKMIYRLRDRRIAFYEALLEDYLANKNKYDKAMLDYY
jgi:hypothetical protein